MTSEPPTPFHDPAAAEVPSGGFGSASGRIPGDEELRALLALAEGLEGEPAAINKVYARVEKDPRHHSVLRMLDGEAEERLFADWSMAFRPNASLSAALKDEIAELIVKAPQEAATSGGRRALRLIDSFIQSMR
jgi:hypothetical protein